ncbi:MAG: dephospho-CoA kinase [Aestuariivirga sp.]
MIVVGLTGSIAMGKSETAKLFRSLDVPVFDSDAEVHAQYEKGGAAVAAVAHLFPQAIVDGAVDRAILSKLVVGKSDALRRLEAAVHPIVRQREQDFIARCKAKGHAIAVLDIPLLFETGREDEVDAIVVVSASSEMQKERVLRRPGMTGEKLESILARQAPDAEKRARADFIVDTSQGLAHAESQIGAIVKALLKNTGQSP